MKVLKLITLFALIFVFASISGLAVQVIVKGKVIDEYTGKPTEAQIEFKTSSGTKFKIKSNSLDGSFSQVFSAGETVDATFTNFDLIKTTSTFKVDDSDKFKEQSLDLKVKKLTLGTVVYQYTAFPEKNATINSDSKTGIQKLEEIMTFNRNVKFEISVNSHDVYAKLIKTESTKKSSKKGKKTVAETETKKTIIEPSESEIKTLVDSRISQINDILKTFKKFQNRVTITPDYSSADATEDASSLVKNTSIKIIVKEIKNQLE
jgi:hypothetical protein